MSKRDALNVVRAIKRWMVFRSWLVEISRRTRRSQLLGLCGWNYANEDPALAGLTDRHKLPKLDRILNAAPCVRDSAETRVVVQGTNEHGRHEIMKPQHKITFGSKMKGRGEERKKEALLV
jgi:hypothetical protein